jgi:formyl-CoA transferase
MMLQSDRYWPDLCTHLGREDLITDPRFANAESRLKNVSACIAELDGIFASKTLDEWRAVLDSVEGVWDAVQSPAEVAADAQAIENGYFPEIEHWDGQLYRAVASPVQFGQEVLSELRPGPDAGQHTEEVLLELGIGWDRIAELKNSKAIM